ncbi:MAG: TonB-dependent receptor [Cryomorphaceae bacterium]|nr:MAG: TonB-dependent receptor [Cryomorphaceae bacterium]
MVILIFISLTISSQTTQQLDEVVVSDSKISIPFSKNFRSVQVVDSKTIQETAVRNVTELLQLVTGLDIRRRGVSGTQADLYIRGGGFDQTLLLIDGMKMDDIQTGHHTLNLLLPIQLIERIEIIKGPAARIFGQNAFNGSINIVTKLLKKSQNKVVEIFANDISSGSYDQFNYSVNLRTSIEDKFNSLIAFHRTRSDGYRYNTDFKNDFIFMKANIKSKNGSIDLVSGFTEKKFGANGFYASPDAIDQYEETQSSFFGFSTKFEKEKLIIKPKLYWRRNQDEYIYIRDNPEIYRNLHISNKIYFDLNFIKYYDSGSFSNFGIDNSQSYISSNNLGSHERFTSTIYLDHTFKMMNDKLIISPGFSVSYFSDLSFHFFPGLDLGYHISEKSKLYANFGKTYRIPTYTDLYYSDRNTIGNPDLEPEHAISNELGFKYDSEKIKFSTSFFQRKSTNIIDYVKESEGDKWKATNIRNLDTKGFDFDFNYINLIRVGYTYLFDDSYVNEINFSRYAINSFRHQLTTRLLLNYSGRLSQNLIYKYGERSDKSNHSVVDTNINYRLGNKSYLFISINNILDTSYSETNLVPMPGRNFLFGFINYLE